MSVSDRGIYLLYFSCLGEMRLQYQLQLGFEVYCGFPAGALANVFVLKRRVGNIPNLIFSVTSKANQNPEYLRCAILYILSDF